MTEKKDSKIKVEDLPEPEKELTTEEAKGVQGGVSSELASLSSIKAADGSVKPQDGQNLKAGASEVLMIKH